MRFGAGRGGGLGWNDRPEMMMTDAVATRAGSAAVGRLFTGGPVLCDGAMGTMLYARGVFINRCYDELNLSQPDMVREVHAEYLQAGAEVVETNTFGANR